MALLPGLIPERRTNASKSMEQVTRDKIRRYKVATYFWLMFFLALGAPLCMISAMFGANVLFAWYQARMQRVAQMEAELDFDVLSQRFNSSMSVLDKKIKSLQIGELEQFSVGMRGCRICGAEYYPNGDVTSQMCQQLTDVFPHYVVQTPPENNPWAWSWYQFHGYAPPPADWPLTKPYLPSETWESDPAEALAIKGREYWSRHSNHLWDIHYTEPPMWYVDLHLKESVA